MKSLLRVPALWICALVAGAVAVAAPAPAAPGDPDPTLCLLWDTGAIADSLYSRTT